MTIKLRDSNTGKEFDITDRIQTVGRSVPKNCAISNIQFPERTEEFYERSLNDPKFKKVITSISREHLEIALSPRDPELVLMRDCGSTNGTYYGLGEGDKRQVGVEFEESVPGRMVFFGSSPDAYSLDLIRE